MKGSMLSEEVTETATRRRLRWPLRPLTSGLVLVLVAGTCGLAAVSRGVVRDQESRLLNQRAAEASALLSLSTSGIQEAFRSLSTLVQLTGSDTPAFATAAGQAVNARVFTAVAVVRADGSGYRIEAAQGDSLEAGRAAPPAASDALGRAAADGVFVTTPVYRVGDSRRLGYATLVPGASPRTLVYGESVLNPPAPSQPSAPFGDLEGALYAASRPDPESVLISSPGFRPDGRTASRPVQAGRDQWLLIVSAKHPLVGSVAERQPWLVLIAGLATTLLLAALVEVLLRRRRYAMTLVDERTGQLQETIQELDAAQQQLVIQERLAAIGQLASAVGHELRNPLGVLSNVVYLLGTKLGRDDPWLDRQLRTAEREVGAATLIVSDLLQFAKPREPIFGEVELPVLVDEVLGVAPPPDGVTVAPSWSDDLPPVRGDRDQLRQVLLNLVTNAYDAMPDGGLLALSGTADADGVRLCVGDTGGGMSDDVRGRIFEPFFTTKAKGIGLGLAVTRRIVEAHGGSIAVTSSATGSSFEVRLQPATVAAEVTA
jgi:signal transduction histidine kinase